VSTTNDGQGDASAYVCVLKPVIQIAKTADATSVNAGDQIGFTLTVTNPGAGDAYGVMVHDVLPNNAGLDWSIKSQTGFGGSCVITGIAPAQQTLDCGGVDGVTVPANTTDNSFSVHIVSGTTKATGVASCEPNSGNVNNTGHVSTTNDGQGDASAYVCVLKPVIQIAKTADAAQVNQGDPIGFTLTVYNAGAGDAYGVKLSDPLPTNTGLSWQIDSHGTGWGNTCSITAGTLNCGGTDGVTVPAGTTQGNSTFTVHIKSPTGAGTGGLCPTTGVVNNTGDVTTSNDGSAQSSASTCVEGTTDLQITKTGSPATQDVGPPFLNITWTMVVTNNGPDMDTNVQVQDPMPAGNTYVSSTTTAGTCTGGAILTCNLGTMQVGASVTITLVTHPSGTGLQTNTAVVAGDLPETNTTNNRATATVLVNGPAKLPCTAIAVMPKQLFAGRTTTMHIRVTQGRKAIAGVRVRIKGPGISAITKPSDKRGKILKKIHPKKAGVVTFRPIVTDSAACGIPRIGITGVFTPPVTG
jgi:uncharacterized repeat protein (TIGR01451 family)